MDSRAAAPLVRMALAGVLVLASVLYLTRLDRAPRYVGSDEARFAIQAHALATTGRDINGTRTPLFFHITNPLVPGDNPPAWWQPLLFYSMAAVFHVAPLSQWSLRLPVACLAILDVWLIAGAARRLFSNPWYSVIAALMLTLTPAHFVLGRQAMDYFCPIPFVLAWLWCLLLCLQTDKSWWPVVTGLVLGLGLYSYITSWIVMPLCLVITLVVLLLSEKAHRATFAVGAGFAVMLLPLIPWLWFHPDLPAEMLRNYTGVRGPRLTERVSLYWDYFNISYLFFSGGSNPMWATRRAGVFLLASAPLMAAGIWRLSRRDRSAARFVILLLFLFAPVPIVAMLPEDPRYFTPRDLLVVPFGTLICVIGTEWLVARRVPLVRLGVALLIAAMPIQFVSFVKDYFTDYQVRSAYRFDDVNWRDVAAFVLMSDATAHVPAVYLTDDFNENKVAQWKFHLLVNRRRDVWERTKYVAVGPIPPDAIPSGSLLVVHANDVRLPQLLGSMRWTVAEIVNGAVGEPNAAILRRR